jgi:hypothetical protein
MKQHYEVQSQNTMSQWPIKVKRPEQIPESFVEELDKAFGAAWPYTVFIPPSKWDADGKRSKVFSMLDDGVMYFEDMKTEVKQLFYPFENILYVEMGRMLLSSWMTIHGIVGGQYRQSTVSYNTVRDDLFDPIIKRIRTQISPGKSLLEGENGERLSDLKQLDMEFLNYTKQSLLPGEKIINIIYQPKVLDESGMSIEMLPEHTHAVVLTDNELILIKEDNHKYKNIHSNYGVIRDFIPLAHIRNVMTESQQTGVRMHVNIEDRDEVDRVFEQTQSERLANLIQKFKSLMH